MSSQGHITPSMVKNGSYILLAALLISGIFTCRYYKNKAETAEKREQVANHNIDALNDTLHQVKTKDGKPEFDKLSFLTDEIGNLKKLNEDLFNTVRNIKGSVSTVIKGDVRIVHDTTQLAVRAEVVDSIVTAQFKFDSIYSPGNSRSLAGFTQYNLRNGHSNGTLTRDNMRMSFTTGIKDLEKGRPTIFLTSDFPGFVVDSLIGAVIDPKLFKPKTKQHLITTGINIGWVPITYDIQNKKMDINLTRFGASLGINVNLSRLLSLK